MHELHGDEWVAIATFALAFVTFLLVVETTLARRDATSAATGMDLADSGDDWAAAVPGVA